MKKRAIPNGRIEVRMAVLLDTAEWITAHPLPLIITFMNLYCEKYNRLPCISANVYNLGK